MRKAQKKQAEEFIKLLGQVHSEIKKAISAGDAMMAQELLGQCQQGAIELGNLIEKTEGEGFVTVSYLEKYCEIVYGIYQEISTEAVVNAEKVYKHLHKELLVIENSVKNDIPLKKEIVFFPYKASMWDSLESVYLAAKEDPECDAYCVPIPYFDKNPDGSFGQIHYEGREYPKNIEVIDWQTYNLEERRPDVVYIHNPYDEYNYVTSVHPRFYSSNLKKYTDELVYIPYFVLGNIDPEDENAVEGMRHFCLQPGVFNADKVILQSEAMAQVYINEYIKAAQAEGMCVNRELLKKKYMGLGSPKLEKVKNTKKENLDIPDEWMRIILKPDQNWKKIIFYNTSITALLQHEEKMLEKMKWVFDVFREKQEEIVLLWRPHPLIKATIESMRPELWKEYEKLVNEYKAERWGIYDDSADVNRAIALSDAYYGDPSSVVQLCQAVEMPVMIQNMKNDVSAENEFVLGRGMFLDGDFIWMLSITTHSLMKIEKSNGKVTQQLLEASNSAGSWKKYLYTDIVPNGDLLYLAPTKANSIAVYNKMSGEISEIAVNIPRKYAKRVGNYACAVRNKDYILFVGICDTNAIARLNISTNKIDYFGDAFCNHKAAVYGRNVILVENKLYVPIKKDGLLYILDIHSGKENVISVDEKKRSLNTINYNKDQIYITTDCGQLLKLDSAGKLVEEIKLPNKKMFYSSYCREDCLWLFPLDIMEYGIKMDLKEGIFETFIIPNIVYNVIEEGKHLWLNTKGSLLRLDEQNQIEEIRYDIGEQGSFLDLVKKWSGENIFKGNMYEGNPKYFGLQLFLDNILDDRG